MDKPTWYSEDCNWFGGDLNAVKWCYLEAGEVPEGYAATDVPGVFVANGISVPDKELLEFLARGVVVTDNPEHPQGWGEATTVHSEIQDFTTGITYWGISSISSFPFSGYAHRNTDGTLQVDEMLPEHLDRAFEE